MSNCLVRYDFFMCKHITILYGVNTSNLSKTQRIKENEINISVLFSHSLLLEIIYDFSTHYRVGVFP